MGCDLVGLQVPGRWLYSPVSVPPGWAHVAFSCSSSTVNQESDGFESGEANEFDLGINQELAGV